MPPTDLTHLYDAAPRGRLLSNGSYRVLVTGAGSGCSSWGETQLNGWEGDRIADADGLALYLRDLDDGMVWSLGAPPCGVASADSYSVHADDGVVVLRRRQHGIEAAWTLCVLPDGDAELRRLVLRNDSPRPRRLALTAALSVVLNGAAAHAAHPAFSKLFVETEWLPPQQALLARRRPRSTGERPPLMAMAAPDAERVSWETDRAVFEGRNRGGATPLGVERDADLGGGVGSVLDPVMALREALTLAPGATVQRDLVLAAAADRAALLTLLGRCADPRLRDGAAAAARGAERARQARLGIDATSAGRWQDLAAALLYLDPRLAAGDAAKRRARGGLPQIWAHALGGRPLVALLSGSAALQRQVLAAHAYWSDLGLALDLLVVCRDAAALRAATALTAGRPGVVVRTPEQMAGGALDVAVAYAALLIDGAWPQLSWGTRATAARRRAPAAAAAAAPVPRPGLRFDNGVGGFTADGREYVMQVGGGARPPQAWSNVVANPTVGFLATESGGGYTWSRNSREHRLTPWSNDPLADAHGEALYIRLESNGAMWSPQPGPVSAPGATYEVRHGQGYSRWTVEVQGLRQDVVQFVPRQHPLKLTRLRLTNTTRAPLRLSVLSYARVVLGVNARDSARFVVTERDADCGALLAHNRVADEFSDGVMFAALTAPPGARVAWSTDRATFIGRGRCLAAPAALDPGAVLAGGSGTGLDPCLAWQATFTIAPGATAECVVLLGETTARPAVTALARYYGDGRTVEAALASVSEYWRELTGAVQVETPVPAIDLMVNGWLLYQVLGCRMWARSALYQSGGAYGFRDQLQDAVALVYARPALARAQLLLHAAHQFVEGDVLHWWHPPLGRGIRTRFSDDLLWLPFLTAYYVGVSGDRAVLDEPVGFLRTRALNPGEDEAYLLPERADERASLFEHCCRALDRSLTRGAHGLPLMGTGDWNDGMNRVGREGRGESVWVGFFLFDLLRSFIPLCQGRGEIQRAERYAAYRAGLEVALNDGGWDGAWYRRAYFDDGTPLGSAQNDECRIDALAQSWAVISGAAPPPRAHQAMDAAEAQLVVAEAGLIRLLTPPFDQTTHDPGYIKGYVPGIRENGGQYTHGAMWVVEAEAMLGRRDRAAAYLEMLSPVSHTATPQRVAVYQVEPYVVVADVYGVAPHVGRGGWSWYTGSAGWMYRIGLERVLGVRVEDGATLVVDPRVPDAWPGFTVRLHLDGGAVRCVVTVENPSRSAARVAAIALDGVSGTIRDGAGRVPLPRDGAMHQVRVRLA